MKDLNFRLWMHVRRDVFLDVCRVLCAEVVGATSSEGFLFQLGLLTDICHVIAPGVVEQLGHISFRARLTLV